jgi:glycosyltransferase involved in cell wall biosynthesis
VRIAYDVTPLLGDRTGVGAFAAGALGALIDLDAADIVPYALSWRGRSSLPARLPAGSRPPRWPMAARPLRALWTRADWPPVELWTGAVDVVHGTNFVVPPSRRGRQVVTIHDLTAVRFPDLCTADTLAYPGLIRRALARGAVVHTPSAFVGDEVVEHFDVDPARVFPVHHGIPPVAHAMGPSPAGPGRYVLALGTIEPRKGLPDLVAAFDQVAEVEPDLRLVIAGADGWGIDAFDRALAQAKHRARVVRLGFVSGDERAALLRQAHVFAYPSIYEGFGFPPLEAMVAGVPVVSSSAGALSEVLGEAAALVAPHDVDGLARALLEMLSEDRRQMMVDRGRERIGHYSWHRCAEGLMSIYATAG